MAEMRTLIAVAHADDETLGCFTLLSQPHADLHILHATDSCPLDPKYALRAGFSTLESYRAARREETLAVLARLGIPASNYHCLGFPDQAAPPNWPRIRAFVEAFRADRVYTHAYEGGHPDHDAVAFALAGLPGVWEFPLYHAHGADFVAHSFLPGPPADEFPLTPAQIDAKRDCLALFASQRRVIDMFPVERESFRPQAQYDFAKPPHEGELYYERRQLGWTWPEWRAAISAAR